MHDQLNARRARILEAARTMIAARGYARVTMRDLAAACGVSVPTLYNQFGGKEQLLTTAISQYFRLDDEPAVRDSARGLPRIITLVDQNAGRLLQDAPYHRKLLEAFGSLESTHGVQHAIARRFAQTLGDELQFMQARRELKDWVEPAMVAAQITGACIGTSIQWGGGAIADDSLQAHMRYATGLVLLGVCSGAAYARLETSVVDAQNNIHLPVADTVGPASREGELHGQSIS